MKLTTGRIAAAALIVAGAGFLGAAGLAWSRGTRDVRAYDAKIAENEKALESIRAQRKETSLRFQAFQKSLPNMPDSMRVASGGEIRAEGREYDRVLRKLDFTERDVKLDISHDKRKRAEAEAARKSRTLPFAAAGAGAFVAGAFVAAAARRKAA